MQLCSVTEQNEYMHDKHPTDSNLSCSSLMSPVIISSHNIKNPMMDYWIALQILSIRDSKAPLQALSASGDPIAPGDD